MPRRKKAEKPTLSEAQDGIVKSVDALVRDGAGIEAACRTLGVSVETYRAWKSGIPAPLVAPERHEGVKGFF